MADVKGTLFSGSTALTKVNSISNQFNRIPVKDKLQYETDPLVTGFFFNMYKLPKEIFTGQDSAGRGAVDVESGASLLAATNVSIELPTITLNPVKIDGLGGTFMQVPGRMDIGDTVTTSNWETTNAEVTNVVRQWIFTLRDPRTGSARVGGANAPQGDQSAYRQGKYKGQLFYMLTDPNIDRVIFAIEFMGIWPKTLPLNNITNSIETNDKAQVQVDFAYDRLFMFPVNADYAANQILAERFKQVVENEQASGEGSGGG